VFHSYDAENIRFRASVLASAPKPVQNVAGVAQRRPARPANVRYGLPACSAQCPTPEPRRPRSQRVHHLFLSRWPFQGRLAVGVAIERRPWATQGLGCFSLEHGVRYDLALTQRHSDHPANNGDNCHARKQGAPRPAAAGKRQPSAGASCKLEQRFAVDILRW